MRQVTRMHRTLTVLAVGLLALAAPLVAMANKGGPPGGSHLSTASPRGRLSGATRLCERARGPLPSSVPALRRRGFPSARTGRPPG